MGHLYLIGYLAESLAPSHKMPVATTFQVWQPKCLQTLSNHSSDENLSIVTIRIQFHLNCWSVWNELAVRNNMFHSQFVGGTPNSFPVLSERSLYLPVPCKSRHRCGVEREGCSLVWRRPMTFQLLLLLHCQHTFSLEKCLFAEALEVG